MATASSFAPGSGRASAPPPTREFDGPDSASRYIRGTVVAFSLIAAAVHFAFAPDHFAEKWSHGVAFLLMGWAQVALAITLLIRPRRWTLAAGIVGNLLIIATWALSRTVGLPSWLDGNGEAEAVGNADLICTVLEGLIVIGSAALFAIPELARKPVGDVRIASAFAASAITIAMIGASLGINPSTSGHSHAEGNDHHAVEGGGAVGHHSTEHSAADREASGARHHSESEIVYDQLPPGTKAEVDQVIAVWAHKYPTAADAAKDGWFRGSRSLYGIGAHYVKGATSLSIAVPFDLLKPNILLYDGDGPDAKFAGVSYVVAGDVEGFTGDFDSWHSHKSVCIHGSGIVSLSEDDSPVWLSESECTAKGGRVMPLANDKMMHLWIGPGYTDAPIFAHDNPKLFTSFNPKRDAWN